MIRANAAKLVLIASLTSTVYGQLTTNPRTAPSDDQFQKDARDQFVRDINRVGQSASVGNGVSNQNNRVLKAIAQFSSALAAYRTAVTTRADWENPLKVLEQSAQDLDTITRVVDTPGFDKKPYAALSRNELAVVTLKFAESVNADLLGLSRLAESPTLILQPDARTYVREIHGQVLQLRFLISKTQSAKK